MARPVLRELRPACPRDHIPASRGCRQRRSVCPHTRGHFAAAWVTRSHMRTSATKLLGKWLSWSAQTGAYQTESPAKPGAETGNRAQIAHQMPEPLQTLPMRLALCAKYRQYRMAGILIGECRVIERSEREHERTQSDSGYVGKDQLYRGLVVIPRCAFHLGPSEVPDDVARGWPNC